ncbi:hypothetical protein CAJAP_04876 [Camponotus japonicus]
MRLDSGTKYDSMRGELYHFSGERKRFTQFIRALLERIRIRCSLRERFSFNNAFSLLPAQTSSIFHACTQPMAAARSRARLSPLDANKSRNSDAPNTRGFRVCRWNLISAAFVTKHAAVLFSPFSTQSCSSSLTIHSLRSFLNVIEVSAERDTIFA